MLNIIPILHFVKKKTQKTEEKPCWRCLDDFDNQQQKADSSVSFDISLAKIQKSKIGGVLASLEGDKTAFGGKKSGFGGEKGKGCTTLLDTTEISRQIQPRKAFSGENYANFISKLQNCGNKVVILECKQCGNRHLVPIGCGLRTCPYCASDRARKVYREIQEKIKHIQRKKGYRLKIITLSYGTEGDIRSAIEKSKEAFKKIWHNLLEKESTGAVITIELGEENLSVHLHCLYYGPFIPRNDLIKEWKRLAGKWYVDIRKAEGKKAIKEVIKYIGKGILNLPYETLFQIEIALKGVRRLVTYGIFYKRITGNKNICPVCHSSSWKFIVISEFNHELVSQLLIQRQFWEAL